MRKPVSFDEGNGLGRVHVLKLVDDFGDELSRDVHRNEFDSSSRNLRHDRLNSAEKICRWLQVVRFGVKSICG